MTAINSELGADFERPFQPAHHSAPAHSIFGPLRSHATLGTARGVTPPSGAPVTFLGQGPSPLI